MFFVNSFLNSIVLRTAKTLWSFGRFSAIGLKLCLSIGPIENEDKHEMYRIVYPESARIKLRPFSLSW